jgi:hypothetical protein
VIKVQLCPAGELEDKTWWYVDVAVLIISGLAMYMLTNTYLDIKRSETQTLMEKKVKWEQELEAKKPSVEKFKNLKAEMELLNRKIGALKLITTSKIDKVKPIVALDQLQTLWMDGVWYDTLEYKLDGTTTIKGSANDSLLVGEYMLGVRETMNPDTVNDDIRTQLGFDHVSLKVAREVSSADDIFPDISRHMSFELIGHHIEKKHATVGAMSVAPRPRASGYRGF